MRKQSLIVRFISWILGIVATVVIVIGAAYVVIKMKYDVDLFATVRQVVALSQKVDEDALLTNRFDALGLDSAVAKINASLPTLITKNSDDKYQISSTSVTVAEMQCNVGLTDKEWGSLLNTLFIGDSLADYQIEIGNDKIPFEFVELDFSDFSAENNSMQVQAVFKIDARQIKNKMASFPLSLLKNYIPDYFYLSASTTVKKTGTAFEYQLSDQFLKVNNLSKQDSMSLFFALNKFLSIGEPEDFAGQFVDAMCDAILSVEKDQSNNPVGFMGIMQAYDATDFEFVQNGQTILLQVVA